MTVWILRIPGHIIDIELLVGLRQMKKEVIAQVLFPLSRDDGLDIGYLGFPSGLLVHDGLIGVSFEGGYSGDIDPLSSRAVFKKNLNYGLRRSSIPPYDQR
jgi:hypothetical protein